MIGCLGVSCDFEQDDLCGYTQDTKDDFDWTRSQQSTGSSGTGPSSDHTYGTSLGTVMSNECYYRFIFNDIYPQCILW